MSNLKESTNCGTFTCLDVVGQANDELVYCKMGGAKFLQFEIYDNKQSHTY
jgi:hypothetical protein